MVDNPSKIAALVSAEDDNSNNDAKQLSELAKVKQGQDAFEQFQANLLVQKPTLASELSQKIEPFSTIFPREITNLTISYMRDAEIPQLGAMVPSILLACRSEIYELMRIRKLVSENLLPHVFGANPDGVGAFLRTSGIHPKILLTKSHYAEGYDSKKLKGFICFRRYKAVSALVGAYRCADFRFGRRILALLLRDNNLSYQVRDGLRCEARLQLSELLDHIGTPIDTDTANIKTSTATNVALASIGAASTTTTTSAAIALSSNNTASNKEKAEFNSSSSANTDKFADSDEFLSAIVKLINAYEAYIFRYDVLALRNKWTEIDALWEEVCECQRRVYHYVKLEFFSPRPFSPLPEFITEPPRGPCRYYNNDLLDLDEIGRVVGLGIYKGTGADVGLAGAGAGAGRFASSRRMLQLDLASISHLYKLRVNDLRNTVAQLHSLESALTFIKDIKPQLRIDLLI